MNFYNIFPPGFAVISLILLYVITRKEKNNRQKIISNSNKSPIYASPASKPIPVPVKERPRVNVQNIDGISLYVRICITGLILIFAMIIVISDKFDKESKKWAYGVIGTILGFWLRS